jgi:hypothetical protein
MWFAAGIVFPIVALVAIGYLLPVAHVASSEAHVNRPPDEVFATIADVTRYPEWRSDVSRVQLVAEAPRLRWIESGANGDITFELEERTPPRELRTRIADGSLPFGGRWTYELTPSGSGTHVRITEHGEVYNPLFRVLSRFVFGHTATIEAYLAALTKRLERRRN